MTHFANGVYCGCPPPPHSAITFRKCDVFHATMYASHFGSILMDRAAKLRRLNVLRRSIPHLSASALTALLDDVAKHGVPELHDRKHVREATRQLVDADTDYGKILVPATLYDKAGNECTALIVNPLALIWKAFEQDGGFTDLMVHRLQQTPPSPERPWRLVL